MKTMMKWTEKEKEFIFENLNSMSNKILAESLNRTPKMIGSYLWKNHITRSKNVRVVSPKIIEEKKVFTNKKFRKTNLKNFVAKSEGYKIDYFELLGKIRKCSSKRLCSAIAGHKSLSHVTENFFCRNTTNEYLFFIDNDDKSYFIKTNIYLGVSLLSKGVSSKNELENWKKRFEIKGVK